MRTCHSLRVVSLQAAAGDWRALLHIFNDEQIPSVTGVCVCACVNSIFDSDNAQIQSLS